MLEILRRRIGVKLFVLLAALILLVMIPLCYMVFSALTRFGNYAADAGRDEAKQQASSYLTSLTREKSHKYDASFSQAEIAVTLMAAQTREIFDNISHYLYAPAGSLRYGLRLQYKMPAYREQDVSTVYRTADRLTEKNLLELQAMAQFDHPALKSVLEDVQGSVSTHLITTSGICRYLWSVVQIPSGMNVYERNPFLYPAIDDAVQTLRQRQGEGKVAAEWTRIYSDSATGSPVITVLSPVIDKNGVLRATAGVDISLAGGLDRWSENAEYSKGWSSDILFSFLLGETGEIINFPKEYLGVFGLSGNDGKKGDQVNGEQLFLRDSRHASVVSAATKIIDSLAETTAVMVGNEAYVFHMHTLHRLNWHLVLVSSEKRLEASVMRTEQALSGTMLLLARKFVIYGALILLVTLLVVYMAVDYFVAPLRRMSEHARRVGMGDLNVRCEVDRDDELGIFARSFNRMVSQLQEAEGRKDIQARQLELIVRERTLDLRNNNIALREVIGELNMESERRKVAVEALKKSEKQIRIVMDASVAGHVILQEEKIQYINTTASLIFGYSREEMINENISVRDLIVPGEYERLQGMSFGRFRQPGEKPVMLACRRKDGTTFDALVGGAVTRWDGKPAVVATIMDISDQKQTEEELLRSKLLLQESLAEKEVLLREIYHRTKNNMLVIISMLQLQAMELEDEKVRILFLEMENRIRAMSLVHERLYQSQNLTEIDLGRYLEEMASTLTESMVLGHRVRVEMDCHEVWLSIDTIVPLGLAINEIVTNSLKHAFGDGRKGRIYIRLRKNSEGMVEVVVGDDGPGLPSGLDPGKARSLGMQIAANLVTGQLRGDMQVRSDSGVEYRIRFAEPERPKRL